MVKKASFFSRLKERWSSGSGVRVEAGRRGGEDAKARIDRVPTSGPAPQGTPGNGGGRPQGGSALVSGAPGDVRSTRKLNDREEASMALGQHFQELSGLLRGVQARMDRQGDRLTEAAASLGQLPALSHQQLAMLQQLAGQVERQNQVGENLARTLTGLPDLLKNVEHALQRAAATDERTASTVREFQATMDRIQGQMGKMVEHSAQNVEATKALAERREESLKGLATEMRQGQDQAVKQLRDATDQGLASLRRTHEDQSNRLHKVVEEHAGWNRAVLVVLGIVVLGMGAILAVLLVK